MSNETQTTETAQPEAAGDLRLPSEYTDKVARMVELENEIDPDSKMTNETRDRLVGVALAVEAIGNDTGAEDGRATREALDNIKALADGASDEVISEVERLLSEESGEVGSDAREIADGIAEMIYPSAPEPAPEREKVWNIHLQAWV